MKGPGLRSQIEVRRTFQCPACGKSVKLPSRQTAISCGCQSPAVWMLLREPIRPVTVQKRIGAVEERPSSEWLADEPPPPTAAVSASTAKIADDIDLDAGSTGDRVLDPSASGTADSPITNPDSTDKTGSVRTAGIAEGSTDSETGSSTSDKPYSPRQGQNRPAGGPGSRTADNSGRDNSGGGGNRRPGGNRPAGNRPEGNRPEGTRLEGVNAAGDRAETDRGGAGNRGSSERGVGDRGRRGDNRRPDRRAQTQQRPAQPEATETVDTVQEVVPAAGTTSSAASPDQSLGNQNTPGNRATDGNRRPSNRPARPQPRGNRGSSATTPPASSPSASAPPSTSHTSPPDTTSSSSPPARSSKPQSEDDAFGAGILDS